MVVSVILGVLVVFFVGTWLVDRRRRRRMQALAEQGQLTMAETDQLGPPTTVEGAVASASASLEVVIRTASLNK